MVDRMKTLREGPGYQEGTRGYKLIMPWPLVYSQNIMLLAAAFFSECFLQWTMYDGYWFWMMLLMQEMRSTTSWTETWKFQKKEEVIVEIPHIHVLAFLGVMASLCGQSLFRIVVDILLFRLLHDGTFIGEWIYHRFSSSVKVNLEDLEEKSRIHALFDHFGTTTTTRDNDNHTITSDNDNDNDENEDENEDWDEE